MGPDEQQENNLTTAAHPARANPTGLTSRCFYGLRKDITDPEHAARANAPGKGENLKGR